jgi:hypothetical protein
VAVDSIRFFSQVGKVGLVVFEVVGRVLGRAFDAFAEREVGAALVDDLPNVIAATPVISGWAAAQNSDHGS